ncbi:MAG: aminotransferase class I/II-fold pyridoxal phosphate-dependent enzyme [Pseudomonadota bacterium]
MNLAQREWLPRDTQTLVQRVDTATAGSGSAEVLDHIHSLAERNRKIHECECFNLNPGTNVMNPRAEALLASGIGSRPSLGYPGDKYEMGLEAIEEIEVIAASLAAELFQARFAEIRAPSGAMANLFGFMALCKPGDTVIVPPATIGGHVTHNTHGCAGLYGLRIVEAPISADGYTVDLDALRALAVSENPRLITLGGSLNLFEHPVAAVREIADLVGAKVLFDAAHQCGLIAGKTWRNPLTDGAHLMTMSTYKSLGGPAGGLVVTNDAHIAETLECVAFPGMTANFDAAKSAALAVTLLDWRDFGEAYAAEMVRVAAALAEALDREGVPVFSGSGGFTRSHQFGVTAAPYGGGQAASKLLRRAGFLACGIGLPTTPVDGDLNGLRIGTPELVRWGMGASYAERMASLIKAGLLGQDVAAEVADWRREFSTMHFVHN